MQYIFLKKKRKVFELFLLVWLYKRVAKPSYLAIKKYRRSVGSVDEYFGPLLTGRPESPKEWCH